MVLPFEENACVFLMYIHFLGYRRRARLEETAGGASTIESGQKRKLNKVIEELDVECELDADSERVFSNIDG